MAQTLSVDVEPLLKLLTDNIRSSSTTSIAVAYLRRSGFSRIRRALVEGLKQRSAVRILIGTGFALTDYQALAELVRLSKKYPNLTCNVFESSPSQSRESFHPKLYLFSSPPKFSAIVGSSNISNDALTKNIEANVLVKGKPSPFWRRLNAMFERWWMMKNSRPLNKDYLSVYRKYKRRADFFQKSMNEDNEIKENQARLSEGRIPNFKRPEQSWKLPTRVAKPGSFRNMLKVIPPRWIEWNQSAQSQYGRRLGQTGNPSSIRFNARSLISDFKKLGFVNTRKTAAGLRIRRSGLGSKLARSRNYVKAFVEGVETMRFNGMFAYSTVGRILNELNLRDGTAGAYLTRDDFRSYIVWLRSDSESRIRKVAEIISIRHRIGGYPSDTALKIDESFAHDRHLISLLASTKVFERAPGRKLVLSAKGKTTTL